MKQKEVLQILNIQLDTISDVLDLMNNLETNFQKDISMHKLIPFLHTYRFVTEAVYTRSTEFSEYPKTEKLDIAFAKLYFEPVKRFIVGDKVGPPWENYFDFCKKGRDIPFLQVLAGICVHINSDLVQAVVDTEMNNEEDFFHIDIILLELVPKLMSYLAVSEHDLIGGLGLIARPIAMRETKRVILKWRETAWENAKKVVSKEIDICQLQEVTNRMTQNLIDDWYQNANFFHGMKLLNHLENLKPEIV